MTKKEIDIALEEIYKEMGSWPRINKELGYVISEEGWERRWLFFIGREELYKLEKAKKSRDKLAADVHEATYELLQATLGLYE
jgi:hypothetical protein